MDIPAIASRRLFLAPLKPEDPLGHYVGWLNDPEVNRYLESRFVTHTLDSVRDYVASAYADPDVLLLGIFLHDGRRHIGNIKLGPIDRNSRRGYLGLLIGDKAEWGRGYAAEAIAAMTDFALGPLGLHKVGAGCYADNMGSLLAFLKAGYVQTGVLREQHWCDDHWVDEILVEKLA